MNDKKTTYIGLLSLSILLLSSCSQEDPGGLVMGVDEDRILFLTSLPDVQTRSDVEYDKNSLKNGFDVTAASIDSITAKGDTIPVPYFSTQLVKQTEGMGAAFRSDGCRWPSNKGTKAGKLRFFSFFPSRAVLRGHAGVDTVDNNYFHLEYVATTRDKKNVTEYWMRGFKVNQNIDKHTDFVTATVEGSKTDNLYSGVNLTFQHQLSKITFFACNNSKSYDIEIAGVRIGGLALESDFSFEGKPIRVFDYTLTRIGRWTGVNTKKGNVEYIFREGDTVLSVNPENYTKIPIRYPNQTEVDTISAVSIMGKGGPALVIPYDYTVWKYKNGYKASESPLYFSVLLRVKEKASGKNSLIYPYIEGASVTSSTTTDKMNVVYLLVESATGKVKKRVYRNKVNKKFYTDPGFSEEYVRTAGEDIRNYGWAAAVPNDPQLRWNPGFQYFYVFDYTNGIGVQDPADMNPGKAIISPIIVSGGSNQWHSVGKFQDVDLELETEK